MYQLKTCVWEITLACCFSCDYCGSRGGQARKNELSTDECLYVAGQLAELGCRRVVLIGGEAFMRLDWDIIARKLVSHKIRTSIITNGYLVSEAIISRLRECKIESVAVSLDGIEEMHDNFRKKQGSYSRAVSAIKQLADARIPVSVITTLNAKNVQILPELFAVLKELPLYAWQLQACSPMGNAVKSRTDFRFDFGEAAKFVKEYAHAAPFRIGVADNIGYYTEEEGYIRGNLSGIASFAGCSAGISSIGIDSVGNIRGCESLYDDCFIEGNVRDKCLSEIWNDPDSFSYNRKFTQNMLTGKCSSCVYGNYCKGGCRSYNHFVHHNLYESPFCAKDDSY